MAQSTSPTSSFVDAKLFARAAWADAYDFSAFYEWSPQEVTAAETRGTVHEAECHERVQQLRLLADTMHEHCASTKSVYAKLECYELLLAKVAVGMLARDKTIADLTNKVSKLEAASGSWSKMESEYETKVEKLTIEVSTLKITISSFEGWYKKRREAIISELNSPYPTEVSAVITATKTSSTTTTTTTTKSSFSSSTGGGTIETVTGAEANPADGSE
ncbi:hypothetical protein AURDEDRAFT_122072 [Auricularia subglabra TFB-10046 SS5]|nr:hypothetical protein AURDEDRAFT_122072 [Auricularia subglabra TFB-10046 SS5]